VIVLPETVQTGIVALEKLTGSPELAVALTVKGAVPKALSPRRANVIVWSSLPAAVTLNDRLTSGAGL
jgi:hypothetical protein